MRDAAAAAGGDRRARVHAVGSFEWLATDRERLALAPLASLDHLIQI